MQVVSAEYKPKQKQLRGDWSPDWPYLIKCLTGTIFFLFFAASATYCARYFPDIDTQSDTFKAIYYRQSVNTTWFPLSQFISFMCLNILGWAFINVINCRPQRMDPFTSGNEDYRSFYKFLIFSPIFFMMSGIVIFKSRHDLDGWCKEGFMTHHSERVIQLEDGSNETNMMQNMQSYMNEDGEIDMHLLFMHTLGDSKYFSDFQESLSNRNGECHTYTDTEIFRYNYFYWCAGFFLLGLQYTHEDFGPFTRFTLVWSVMKTWGWFLWLYFCCWLVLIGYSFYTAFKGYSESGVKGWYIIWIVVVVGYMYWNTKRLAPEDYHVHIHHYVISCLVMTILCYQTPFLTFVHGFFNGMAIEGGARYGFDAIWLKTDGVDNNVEIFERWFHTDTQKHSKAQRVKWILLKALHSKKRAEHQEDRK